MPTSSVTKFRSPTGNLVCQFVPDAASSTGTAYVECQSRNDRATMRIDYYGAKKKWYAASGRSVAGSVLAYGSSRSFDGFTCTSRWAGMTCRATVAGGGFSLSAKSWGWVG